MELQTAPVGIKNQITYYFRQTFRRHTGAEYSELLTRGMHGEGGVNRKYPWAYIRLFALLFVLYAVFVLIVRFTSNKLFEPTITVLAATCINLSFLLLIYELYPWRDLSFLSVCLVMLVCGAGANVVTQILYDLFPSPNAWLKAVYSGFFEELPKAVATVIVVAFVKKKSPLAGFVLGAAVGCGFSVAEDMGYIFIQSSDMPVMDLTAIIDVSAARALSSLCTHILWTGAIGWAYAHFQRHLANIAFYLVLLLSCGLHVAWDLPLGYLALGFVYAGCAVIACTECLLIVHGERKKAFRSSVSELADFNRGTLSLYNDAFGKAQFLNAYEEDAAAMNKSEHEYWRYWGRFTLAVGAFLMAVIAVIYCSISFNETYGNETFYKSEDFVLFMQDGLELDTSPRLYNEHMENYSEDWESVYENGEKIDRMVRVTQREEKNGVVYYYTYTASYDMVTDRYYYFPVSVNAEIKNGQGLSIPYGKEDLYNDGKLYASFYHVNADVISHVFQADGSIKVFTYNPEFMFDLSQPRYLSLFCVFAAIGGAAIVCDIALTIKSWRVKKLCSTKNASSAE